MTRRAPVVVTGGGGFRYENAVAARFLLDLLAGTNSLGADFGRVRRVDWQARDSGWLVDDLVVTCAGAAGERSAGISIKSDQQVTRSGFPAAFVEIAWAQWLGVGTQRRIQEGIDAIVMVTGSLAHEVEEAWYRTRSEALETTPDRMVARLSAPVSDEGSQSSSVQRTLVANFRCPENLRGGPHLTDDVTSIRLLRHVELLHFDFGKATSRHHGLALADCHRILRSGAASDAERLWNRLVGIADAKRPLGASVDLAGLLEELRGEFDLRDHPDYERDWEALDRHSREAMADTRVDIAGLPPLARTSHRTTIQTQLDTRGACFLVGESGCGKSALAKAIAVAHYRRVAWISEAALDHDTAQRCEQGFRIAHPLAEVLLASPEPCLLVFDGIEKYSPRALRLAARLIQDLRPSGSESHVRILFTGQFEAAERIIRRLAELGVALPLLEALAISRPAETEIQNLVVSIPEIQWASLRPELRPLLTNLKVLDWVVAAVRSGQAINDRALVGLTVLIDALWTRWVEDGDGLDRSHLLMNLGIREAETLTVGVPRMQLEHSEQRTLPALVASDLIRIRDERVRFSHDLLADWARLRVLVGEGPLSSPANRERASLPRWHRAVRLYAQRLLEQSPQGCDEWQRSIAQLDDSSEVDRLIRDLFLESVFLATNAGVLLERTWPALTANGGSLLNRMLNRFLFVATLPDSRISAVLGDGTDTAEWEHLARLPYWPYWAPMLTVLHAHRAEVADLVPSTAARICSLWLRTMPSEFAAGQPMPWRREAAELALAIGREIQALNAEGNYFGNGHDKNAYEAVLWAAPELPNEVATLCLELAERRELSPDIRARVEETHRRRQEERRLWLEANPERNRAPPPIGWPRGPRREPWPDGPRDNVQRCFLDACLDSGAFPALCQANSDAALEVLLAVCIEEPQYEDFGNRSRRECGLEYWQAGHAPLYCRGPFLQFLRSARDHGLSFVLKLTNFASRRFVEGDEGLTISVAGQSRLWRGDSRVFRWHHDWPLFGGEILHCALMALERWFYEQIEQGEDIEPAVNRILAESESVAFAGLLLDVGKRQPALFANALKPLLASWQICDWDLQLASLRQFEGMGYWGNEHAFVIQLAQEWYRLPHRVQPLAGIGGAVMQTMIGSEEFWPFFEQLRTNWSEDLEGGEPDRLRLLIERFNPANYTFEVRDGVPVPVNFQWPEAIERQNAEELRALNEEMAFTQLPQRARNRLASGTTPLPEEEVDSLLRYLQRIEASPPQLAERRGEALVHVEDILCAGVAALVLLNHAWLLADRARMDWCRRTLQRIVDQPPAPLRFDSETAPGQHRWDAFAAECGVFFLSQNRDDVLARRLVGAGVLSYHYSTTALTMLRACQCREQLGDDFDRMLGLAVRWSALRRPYDLATRPLPNSQPDPWLERKATLAREFTDQRLPAAYPDIQELNAVALSNIDAVQTEQFPSLTRRPRSSSARRPGRSRQSLYPERLGIDTHVIMAAFAWLDLQTARPGAERSKWSGFVKEFLAIVLALVPPIDDPRQQEIDGLPTDFDGWVWGMVAKAIPRMQDDERPRDLWQPVFDLGSPAHHWVERFFWYWFSDGLRAAVSPHAFATTWGAMLTHALNSPAWDPSTARRDLDDMVFELLGFNSRMHSLAQNTDFIDLLGEMEPLFARAAQKWFAMPKVMTGFLRFAVEPAAANLVLPGIMWLAAAGPSLDSYNWRYGLEDNLITFLRTCWERHGEEISRSPDLHAAFLTLLTTVVSRGGHAAIALRDRVVASVAA